MMPNAITIRNGLKIIQDHEILTPSESLILKQEPLCTSPFVQLEQF